MIDASGSENRAVPVPDRSFSVLQRSPQKDQIEQTSRKTQQQNQQGWFKENSVPKTKKSIAARWDFCAHIYIRHNQTTKNKEKKQSTTYRAAYSRMAN